MVRPVAIFNVLKWSSNSGDWEEVVRLDLATYDVDSVVNKGEILLEKPYHNFWVSRLISVDDSVQEMTCVIGMERKGEAGDVPVTHYRGGCHKEEIVRQVDYWLCKVDIATKLAKKVTLLQCALF
jgi:hypothetical protein